MVVFISIKVFEQCGTFFKLQTLFSHLLDIYVHVNL